MKLSKGINEKINAVLSIDLLEFKSDLSQGILNTEILDEIVEMQTHFFYQTQGIIIPKNDAHEMDGLRQLLKSISQYRNIEYKDELKWKASI